MVTAVAGRIGVGAAGKPKTNEPKEEEAFLKFNVQLRSTKLMT